MKVLLTQDVYNLGHAGEVKTVADGYGRNFLLPRGMAVLATEGAIKRADSIRNAEVKRRAQEQSDMEAVAQVINGATLYFAARTGEKGKLFGSITAANIGDKLGQMLGKEFDKRKVALREPLRDIGTHTVTIRLTADIAPTVNVVITPEGVAAAAPASAPSTPTPEPPPAPAARAETTAPETPAPAESA
jgi:large subunit ribosomal protein L9